jgi:hypothetical protein
MHVKPGIGALLTQRRREFFCAVELRTRVADEDLTLAIVGSGEAHACDIAPSTATRTSAPEHRAGEAPKELISTAGEPVLRRSTQPRVKTVTTLTVVPRNGGYDRGSMSPILAFVVVVLALHLAAGQKRTGQHAAHPSSARWIRASPAVSHHMHCGSNSDITPSS